MISTPNEFQVRNWAECRKLLRNIKSENEEDIVGVWFRGQSNAKWELTTTLERAASELTDVSEYFRLIRRIKPQIEAFTGAGWHLPNFDETAERCETYDGFRGLVVDAYSYLAHLRHHGFPSPFLDWTSSPYIAAYFAFRNASPNEDVAIYAYAERPKRFKETSSAEPEIIALGPIVKTHARHFRQQSRYSICCTFEEHSWSFAPHQEVFDAARTDQDVLWKITLPSDERLSALREFDQYNLNDYTLFGSEEALMTTLAIREID